jgi:uroporphyrinogen III methyltransferase/synthase
MSRLGQITQALLEHGKPPDTPAAVVQWASTGLQHTIEAPLGELANTVVKEGVTAPAVVIVGSVVALRKQLAWVEKKPLFGKRVLVTRPRRQASELAHGLVLLGAVPIILPAVDIKPPADWTPVDNALIKLQAYHWVVFTSVNGVHAFMERLKTVDQDVRAFGTAKLAAIGPKTAEALEEYHLKPDLVPEKFQSENLARILKERIKPGQRILLARADRGRDLLQKELAGIAQVEQIAVYSQVDAVAADSPALDSLRRGEVDYITLTSSNIARALIRSLDEPCRARLESGQVKLVSISPVTSAEVRQMGLAVAAEATEATTKGILEALTRLEAQ